MTFQTFFDENTFEYCKRRGNIMISRKYARSNLFISLCLCHISLADLAYGSSCIEVQYLALVNFTEKPMAQALKMNKLNWPLTITRANQRIYLGLLWRVTEAAFSLISRYCLNRENLQSLCWFYLFLFIIEPLD
jgi:hypothetical protein